MSKNFKLRYGDIALDPANLLQWLDTISNYFNQDPQAWTPALTFATPGDLSVAYSRQTGFWWRIGNLVHVTGHIVTSTFTYTTAAGNGQITGFPVNAKTSAGILQILACVSDGWTKANYTQAEIELSSGVGSGRLRLVGSGQSFSIATTAETPSGTQQTRHFSGSYFTD